MGLVDLAKLLTNMGFNRMRDLMAPRNVLFKKHFLISVAEPTFSNFVGMLSTYSLNYTENKQWYIIALSWKKLGVIMTQSTYNYFLVGSS